MAEGHVDEAFERFAAREMLDVARDRLRQLRQRHRPDVWLTERR